MPQILRDRITGIVLLAVAVVWIVGVYGLIPDLSDGGARIGPRGFPLAMGLLLGLLALLLLIFSFAGPAQRTAGTASSPPLRAIDVHQIWS